MNLKILILSCICFLSFEAATQTVQLSRLQRAAGAGYIPYTNGSGKQVYTLAANVFQFGSGATGRIAAWSADTLRSHIWEINDTYIRGSGTGWPQIENGRYGFRGDADTYMARTGANAIEIFTGSVNPILRMTSGVVNINPDLSALEYWQFQSGLFATTIATGPRLNVNSISSPQYSFSGDINTGMANKSADVLTFHAGDNTNESMKIDGVNDLITFDPNDDGTDDITISSTKTSIAGGLNIGSYTSSPTSSGLLGRADNNDVSSITIGSGLSLTSNTLTATATTLTAGTNIVIAGDSISADIKWPHWDGGKWYGSTVTFSGITTTLDTFNFPGDMHIGDGIEYSSPLSAYGSSFSGFEFEQSGTYQMTWAADYETDHNSGKVEFDWHINGTPIDAFNSRHVRRWPSELAIGTEIIGSATIQFNIAAGQFLQLCMRSSTGSLTELKSRGFHIQIHKIRD